MNAHTLWYMTRATGIVALVLLTATTVLGVASAQRVATERWPRFAWQDLHRRLSLLSVVFIGLHIATTVADGYAPIGWLSAVVPFTSPYRRLWLGLGTVAVDLLLAVGISSLLRSRIRPGLWRALHWLAYLCWPLAVVHALGTGTDPRLPWVLGLVVACVVAVVLAAGWRLRSGWPARPGLRVGLGILGAVSVIVASLWAASGPLKPGWAKRAGTPATLLARAGDTVPASSASTTLGAAGSSPSATRWLPTAPFLAALTGTLTDERLGGATREIDVAGTTSGSVQADLAIQLVGLSDGGGGLTMEQSSATFGPPTSPDAYKGTVVGLEGTDLQLALADTTGARLDLQVDLTVDGSTVQGEVSSP